MILRVASMPSMPGIIKSIVTRSGRSVAVSSTASAPVDAWPMTRISGSELSSVVNTSRVTAESSTTRTRTTASRPGAPCVWASGIDVLPRRAANQAPHRIQQLRLIELALQDVRIGPHFEALASIVDSVAGGDDDDRNIAQLFVGANALGQ